MTTDAQQHQLIGLLADIASEGKLGELRERWSYARREVAEHDAQAMVHARLDASNIAAVAADLLGIGRDAAMAIALEQIAPDPMLQAAIDLTQELHEELFGPQHDPEAIAPSSGKEQKW